MAVSHLQFLTGTDSSPLTGHKSLYLPSQYTASLLLLNSLVNLFDSGSLLPRRLQWVVGS